MELNLKTLLGAEIENAMLIPQDPELQFTPAVVPAMYGYMFTPQGERDWAPILEAPVTCIAVKELACGKSGLVVELDTEDAELLMNFGNLLAGNCTQAQAKKWLTDPAFPANGYTWDGPGEGGQTQETGAQAFEQSM